MTSPDNLPATCEPPPAAITPIDEVIGWITEGHRDCDIREAIRAKWPENSPDELQLAAADHFRNVARCEAEILVGFAIEAHRDLYRRMVKIGDFAGAAKAIKEITNLLPHVFRFRIEQNDRERDEDEAAEPAPTE